MKKSVFFVIIFLVTSVLWAQQKYALVIGNASYTGISTLKNPVNDANDMAAQLRSLGFDVERVTNGNLNQMLTAVTNLKRKLGASLNAYGFFFYAGHGVQASGENYLIPINAENILSENLLRQYAVSLQFVLDELSDAGNELNMIVLDACRDNPFGWSRGRGGDRGLAIASRAPAGSIVMYATSVNSVADDGTGQNGLFTGQLLNNLKTPGVSVRDLFDKTGADVLKASGGKQHPELSIRYFGAASAYLGSRPANPPQDPDPPTNPPPSSTAKAHFDKGQLFMGRSEWDIAILEFNDAIRLDPNYAEAYRRRGLAYRNKKDYDRAIADYNQAIQLNPSDDIAYNNRGNVYYDKKDYDRAIADYNQSIRFDPNYALAYHNRGAAYWYKKDYDRAIADYNQAIQLDPNYAKAYWSRGLAYEQKGELTKADADKAKARELGYKP
jgi:Flp pilus assembly protein TadD